MLILLFVICLCGILAGVFVYWKKKAFDVMFVIEIPSVAGLIFVLIPIIYLAATLVSGLTIDEKIEMYESENARIEERVAESVNRYLEHEAGVYGKPGAASVVQSDGAFSIVMAYPELSSSSLIAEQIGVYTDNACEIKWLKEEKINLKTAKWWLYFGS